MNTLRAHAATMKLLVPTFQLNTVVDGYAMSSASVIFMAGTERQVALGGVVMIHDAWGYSGGNADLLRKQADELDILSDNAATIYATLCAPAAEGSPVRDTAFFRKMMKEETYLTGQSVVDCGLATSVDKALEATLFAGLSPETMKGHYVEMMTKRQERHTFSRAVDAASMLEKKKALQALSFLAIELGVDVKKA